MAVLTVEGRAVDIGASDLTVRDPGFEEVVESWHARGLARPWTNTVHLGGPDGLRETTSGPLRWAAPAGLRSLVEDLADGIEVVRATVSQVGPGPRVDGYDASAVVLASAGGGGVGQLRPQPRHNSSIGTPGGVKLMTCP